MAEDSFPVEVRRVEVQVHETGTGQSDRTDASYELGFVVDGAWQRITSVPGATVEATIARERDRRPPEPSGPTMADVSPTPAPQAAAAESGESQTI